jgi:hypothetical protein
MRRAHGVVAASRYHPLKGVIPTLSEAEGEELALSPRGGRTLVAQGASPGKRREKGVLSPAGTADALSEVEG